MHSLLQVPAWAVLSIIGALVFGEAAVFLGFVLPGETAVLLGGFLASTGKVSLVVLALVVVACAIVGDTVGYEVGRRFGPRILASKPMRKHEHRIDGARSFLSGRGAAAVFLGRFTAFLRAVMPGLAGLSGMRYLKFLAFNAAGGLVWGLGCVLAGYYAGRSYEQVASYIGRGGAVLFAVVAVVGFVVWRRRRSQRKDASGSTEESPGAADRATGGAQHAEG